MQFNSDVFLVEGDSINIGVRSRPIKGQANKEVIKKVADHFGIPTSLVQIKAGSKSDKKIVEILD